LEVGEHAHPELRGLPAALPGPQPEHVAPPGEVDPDGGVERAVPDLPVADLHVDRVEKHRRVDRLQRPGRPRLHFLDDLVGDPGDRVPGDRGAVDLGDVRADLPGRHPLGVERDRDRVHVGQASLPLLDDNRVEGAGPIAWHLDLHLPGRVGQHRLRARAVADVALRPGRRLVLLVPEVLGELLLQSRFQHRLRNHREQPVRAGQIVPAGACRPHQLTDRGPLTRSGTRHLLPLLRRRGHVLECFGHR
jgi:hypothetical protein